MFREMRRSKQRLSMEDTIDVMNRCTNGIMACTGDDDYPYAVPLSYAYLNNKIYFHAGREGHKIDAIMKNPKVSFAVVDKDTIVSKEYTSYFRSVIAFGKARIVEGGTGEWREALKAIVDKYSGDQPEEEKLKEIGKGASTQIIRIDIDHMTGKEAIELVRARENQ